MSRVLEELWYGNITPIDRNFKKDSEFTEAVKMLSKNETAHYTNPRLKHRFPFGMFFTRL